MELTDTADLGQVPLAELLTLIGELFAGSLASRERARRLRAALGELDQRAGRLCHPAPSACLCGESFGTADELDQHFYDVFLPDDDIGADGRPHAEIET